MTASPPSPRSRSSSRVFASDSDLEEGIRPSVSRNQSVPARSRNELSDLPQVRRLHVTTGYRDGLSAGKDNPETAQRGFDEGFPAGAEIGKRIGWILGSLRELEVLSRGASVDQLQDGTDYSTESASDPLRGSEGSDYSSDQAATEELSLDICLKEFEQERMLQTRLTVEDLYNPEVERNAQPDDNWDRSWELPAAWFTQARTLSKWQFAIEKKARRRDNLDLKYPG